VALAAPRDMRREVDVSVKEPSRSERAREECITAVHVAARHWRAEAGATHKPRDTDSHASLATWLSQEHHEKQWRTMSGLNGMDPMPTQN
jgi:hypothetical protein